MVKKTALVSFLVLGFCTLVPSLYASGQGAEKKSTLGDIISSFETERLKFHEESDQAAQAFSEASDAFSKQNCMEKPVDDSQCLALGIDVSEKQIKFLQDYAAQVQKQAEVVQRQLKALQDLKAPGA